MNPVVETWETECPTEYDPPCPMCRVVENDYPLPENEDEREHTCGLREDESEPVHEEL